MRLFAFHRRQLTRQPGPETRDCGSRWLVWLVFAELPTMVSWAGALVMLLGGLALARR
ncbi:MAG: hypothetical protein RIC87_07165 [Kiloniellales bacterium]